MTAISPATNVAASSRPRPAAKAPGSGIVRTLGRWSSYVLLLAAALIALVMIVAPVATGSQTYTVLTSSMAPKYAPGTFLVVKPTPFSQLGVGDVITYQIESGKPGVITHRVTAVGATQTGERVFTTKGDNNSLADAASVHEVQVQGKLLYAVPYVGFAANAVSEKRGDLLPIAAIGLIGLGMLSMIRGGLEKKGGKKQTGRRSL